MARTAIIILAVVIAALLIFEICDKNVAAQTAGDLSEVLQNQKTILMKLDALDKKLDVLKMRIRM